MKIPYVHIENFLAIGEAEFSLDSLGLVHISGVNNDETSAESNGSGKSSLGDAISWCLWGSTARGVGGDDVVNAIVGKATRVITQINDAGELWEVRRHRKYPKKQNALELWRHDGTDWQDVTKGTNALTQAAIERLLGCSEDVFNAAVYSGQECMPDIPNMTDRQLKQMVEQAAGVDVLATAHEIARERFRERSQTTAEAQITLDRATQRHDDAKAQSARLKQQFDTWETDQKNKLGRLKRDTQEAVKEFHEAKAELDPEGKKGLLESIDTCRDAIAAVNAERDRETLLAQDADNANTARTSARASQQIAERDQESSYTALIKAKNDLVMHEKSGDPDCPSCGQSLGAEERQKVIDHAKVKVATVEKRLEDTAAELAKTRIRVKAADQAAEKAGKALKEYRDGMTDVSAEADKLKNLQRELQVIEATEREVERVKQQAKSLGEQYTREKAQANPFVDLIEQNDKDIIDRALDVEAGRLALTLAKEEEAYALAVVNVFAPDGVRAHRLDEATPFLNERTSHYLGSLADGAIEAFWTTVSESKDKKRLMEKFSVTVEKPGGAPSFKNLSGGEKRKVRLACALALQDLVATRAAKSIELWIGDEIDDALDDAGLERLMGVLEEKARDRGTVLVISHNDIAHYARKTMHVEKVGGLATVTVN